MKKLTLILTLVAGSVACQQAGSNSSQPTTVSVVSAKEARKTTTIQWLDSTKQIGKITEGEKVEVAYRFVNTGNEPLVIENVVPTCGCTVAEKPEAPIAPGKEGVVKAVFDSHGRAGTQHKSITVYANTETMVYPLTFDVDVIGKSGN